MAIEGPLHELAISDVLQLLDLSRKTGVLTVHSDAPDQTAVLRFDRGAVTGASFPGHAARLGELLLLAGRATAAQVERALDEQRRAPGRRLGALLVEGEGVGRDEVLAQLRFQLQETIFELIRWEAGDFRFEEAPAEDAGPVSLRVPVEALLMEAARRLDEWARLASKIPHRDVVPRLVDEEGTEGVLSLAPHEWEVLAQIDGERSLRVIARSIGRGEFEVAKSIFALVSSGVVEVGARREAAAPPPLPEIPRLDGVAEVERALGEGRAALAETLLEPLVRAHPERGELHVLRGRIAAARGEWDAARRALEQATRLDPLLPTAYFHLGVAALRAGEMERAEEAWGTCLRLAGAEPRHHRAAREGVGAIATLRRLLDEEAGR